MSSHDIPYSVRSHELLCILLYTIERDMGHAIGLSFSSLGLPLMRERIHCSSDAKN